jgi:hypothetical protein
MGKARAGRHGKKKAKWTRVDHDRRFQREFLFAAKGWFGGAVMMKAKRKELGFFFCGLRVRAKLSNLFYKKLSFIYLYCMSCMCTPLRRGGEW